MPGFQFDLCVFLLVTVFIFTVVFTGCWGDTVSRWCGSVRERGDCIRTLNAGVETV